MENSIIIILLLVISFLSLSFKDIGRIKILSEKHKFLLGLRFLKKAGFSNNILKFVEKIYRLETNNFKSRQFLETYSAGMEVANKYKLYYGWSKDLFLQKPIGYIILKENNTRYYKNYIKFANIKNAMFVLAMYIKKHDNPYRWFALDTTKQNDYKKLLKKIKTPIYEQI